MLARFLLLAVISIGIVEKSAVLGYYARDTGVLKNSDYEELDHPIAEEKEYKEAEPKSVIHYKRTRVKRSDSSYVRPPVQDGRFARPAPPAAEEAPGNQKYDAEGESEESNPKLAFAENHRSPVSF